MLRETVYSKEAEKNEEKNNLEESLRLYLRSAFYRVGEHGFSTDTLSLLAISDLLNSMRIAIIIGDEERTTAIKQISLGLVQFYYNLVGKDNLSDLLSGFLAEFAGDMCLMAGDSDALNHYQNSISEYKDIPFERKMHYANEPEFESAQFAFEDFLKAKDMSDQYPSFTDEFKPRIDYKIELYYKFWGDS